MTGERDTEDDRTDRDARSTGDGVRRRDVVKAVSGAIVAGTGLSDAAAARTTFCGRDDCIDVEKPPKDAYTLADDRARVEFDTDYLDAKMDEGYDTLGIKSGSCTDRDDGNRDCDYVGLTGCTYSYRVPATCNDISHPELLKCEGDAYAFEQGDTCTPVEPLSDGNVADLFGYTPEEPRETDLPAPLEAAQTSRLFLYEGPEGLSLVVVHGGTDAEEGGAATFRVSGLPPDGEFVALADRYEGSEDEFSIREREAVLNWSWGTTNDGGVFRGLGEAFCVEIKPAWNEEAKLEPYGSGTVEGWQFLSGSLDDPEVIDLDMDEPIAIRSGGCGEEAPTGQDSEEEDEKEEDEKDDQSGYTVCHEPPGNPDNRRTIRVGSESALEAHLGHGDSRGPCPEDG
ncbi:hypothetical protein [Halorussus sp. AFM4]|uniref:hypothetical protein n=1 Tax=Halorussus sp. AFM4 TaxID=3421651 RepID=UPI003EB7C009